MTWNEETEFVDPQEEFCSSKTKSKESEIWDGSKSMRNVKTNKKLT